MEDNGVKTKSVQERQRESKVFQLVGKDSASNPDPLANDCSGKRQYTHFKTANLASGRTPPDEPLEEEVKMRRYRSTSCLDPNE